MKKLLLVILFLIIWLSLFVVWYIFSWLKHLEPHYHANFALYIDWTKFDFSKYEYMEPVSSCKLSSSEINPSERVHLHENNWDTIHIHHSWVAWWHFFANNGITFSNRHISFEDWKILLTDKDKKLIFILNWVVVNNPFNKLIKSEDRLLINYGTEKTDYLLKNVFPKVKSDAWEYNSKYDPASCSWNNENKYLFLLEEMFSSMHTH